MNQIDRNKETIAKLDELLIENVIHVKENYDTIKANLEEVDLKDRALHVIEMLCEMESSRNSENSRTLDLIYRLAHSVSCSECEHPEWIRELETIYAKMVEDKIL